MKIEFYYALFGLLLIHCGASENAYAESTPTIRDVQADSRAHEKDVETSITSITDATYIPNEDAKKSARFNELNPKTPALTLQTVILQHSIKKSKSNKTQPRESNTKSIRCLIDSAHSLNRNNSELEQIPLKENAVHIVNASTMHLWLGNEIRSNLTNKTQEAKCQLVFFYASWCPFSAKASLHYNALARLYPDLMLMAVNSPKHPSLHTQYGILALPSLILFHNGKAAVKLNHSRFHLSNMTHFIDSITNLKARGPLEVRHKDYFEPLSTVAVLETDYYLFLSWLFTIVCALGFFGQSSYCQGILESIRNTWQEAEIQHEHQD